MALSYVLLEDGRKQLTVTHNIVMPDYVGAKDSCVCGMVFFANNTNAPIFPYSYNNAATETKIVNINTSSSPSVYGGPLARSLTIGDVDYYGLVSSQYMLGFRQAAAGTFAFASGKIEVVLARATTQTIDVIEIRTDKTYTDQYYVFLQVAKEANDLVLSIRHIVDETIE